MTAPLMQFQSHIDGRNADVAIYDDRLEYSMKRDLSGAKLATGLMTAGMSLAATGFRKKGTAGTASIPTSAITGVSTERDGLRYTKVVVASPSGRIAFRVSHGEAPGIRDLLTRLASRR